MSLSSSCVDVSNLKILFSGTNSIVYAMENNLRNDVSVDGYYGDHVVKKYLNENVANKEIDILEYLANNQTKHSIIPIYANKSEKIIIMRRMSPLNLLPWELLSATNKSDIIKCILLGIKEIHELNLIHNDLKPENILYDPITLKTKLIDFSSSFLTTAYQSENATTPLYNAPDKIKSKASDIWSFGILLLKLLGFEEHPKVQPTKINRTLMAIAYKCLNTDPALRPTASECIELL